MKNRIFLISIISIFTVIFVIFFKGLQNSNIYIPETKANNKIPKFSAELFYSKKLINSAELFSLNKFYLLNIWSSWCVPCRQEHSLLMSLSESKKVNVIGINYKDTKNNAKFFLNELGNPYQKIIFDREGIHAIEWAAYGVPESFLIYNGLIIKRYIGPLSKKSIKEIKLLIK